MDKFTKIIATIGPSCDSVEKIRKLHNAGMNVARLNFSHGDYEYFEKIIKNIRSVSDNIAILLDTKGPEIRSGEIKDGTIELIDDQELEITSKKMIGSHKKISIDYPSLTKLKVGNTILIDDGLIEAEVIKKTKTGVIVNILNGGMLGSKKTISIRGHNVDIPFLSKKDKQDILFGIKHNIDFIAASFVRTKDDVLEMKKLLEKNNALGIKIISKIEHDKAVVNVDEIIKNSKGIMIARGDLGVEVPLQKVPLIQRDIIKKCNELGKPVIVATQMLESMKDNPRPTRAEVADVSAAIIQGVDAIMLSGETASGKYPILSVKMMTRIAKEYDLNVKARILDNLHSEEELEKHSISLYVTKAAYEASEDLKTSAILTPTESGYTARKVSRFKPKCPIFAVTHDKRVLRQLQLSWGVIPMLHEHHHEVHDTMVNHLVKECYDQNYIKKEDKIVVTSGHVLSESGHTNMLEIYHVKDVLKRFK